MSAHDEACALIGDLAVLVHELGERALPGDLPVDNTRGRFDRIYRFGEPLFHLAIATGLACEGLALTAADRAPLVEIAHSFTLDLVLARCTRVFDYIGYEYGSFYGVQAWSELVVCMSAFTFLRELAPSAPDPGELAELLERWGGELYYDALEVPDGMPSRHWWWFAAGPPA
ncbi:MAG: hypothetical protein M3680_31255 [Myxococcota bacterium]|nr:hypothetical protein [Myxococcota bacterium]